MSADDRNLGYSPDAYASLAGFSSDWRDNWWNQDYLELLSRRLGFAGARRVLDVGCGAGHWGQRLVTLLPEGAELVGVDHEPAFLELARARTDGRLHRFEYCEASAETLPFEDGHFDLVTCQTVLMHVADPATVVAEMTRVTRQGGLVLAAEPSNLSASLSSRLATPGLAPELVDRLFVFEHRLLRGKHAIGQGDGVVGEHLPRYFNGAGLVDIQVSSNDKCAKLVSPYQTPAEQADLEMKRHWLDQGVSNWGERATARRLYLAGGGGEADFDLLFELSLDVQRKLLEAVEAGDFYGAGGFMMYVVSGRRPVT